MFSKRFHRRVVITRHAIARMQERGIHKGELLALIEGGTVKEKDKQHFWIYHAFAHRHDNLMCAAAVQEENLVIKTVMIRWELIT